MLEMDVTQSIGRRYRRQDEIGTPFAVTVDFETLQDEAVTIRHRDTMEQDRIPMSRGPLLPDRPPGVDGKKNPRPRVVFVA